jgi:hypothetical protein
MEDRFKEVLLDPKKIVNILGFSELERSFAKFYGINGETNENKSEVHNRIL